MERIRPVPAFGRVRSASTIAWREEGQAVCAGESPEGPDSPWDPAHESRAHPTAPPKANLAAAAAGPPENRPGAEINAVRAASTTRFAIPGRTGRSHVG